jgi:Cellulose biosynthesis protein BcsS
VKAVMPALACALALSGTAHCAESLLLSGTEWSRSASYSYVGALTPLGGGSLGDGWILRQWLDRLTYQYRGATSEISAEGYGFSPALGRQLPLGNTHVGIYGALRVANTSLHPDDRSNADRGTRARFSIQADALTPIAGWAENQLIAQAEFGNDGYFARERLLFRVPGRLTLGPEVVFKGNTKYSARQFGVAFGGLALGKYVALTLRGGVSDQRGQSTVGYGGVELALTR